MHHKLQLLTKNITGAARLWWFWGLMLTVLVTPGCGDVPVEPKPVGEVSAEKTQEDNKQTEDLSKPERAEPALTSEEKAPSLLVLYKSSEGNSAEENIFVYHLQPLAQSRKHDLVYHDIDDSFPSDETMDDIQAIVTVFNGPVMKNAQGYIEWLTRQVNENRKVIIIGNFGAFSPNGKDWYDSAVLNTFYRAFGLEFVGHWTNNPKTIRIAYKNDDMIGYESDISPDMLSHYFLIKSVHPDNVIYLSLVRDDLDDSESAAVVKTPAGGLAMENYVFTRVDEQMKKLLNIEKFFVDCLQ